jgi:acetylornithine deacetylase/succinyl-diaminopimelate desuccinylase-like protein
MMTDLRNAAIQYAHDHRSGFQAELQDFCTIPSISTDPAAKPEMFRAAEWVANQLRSLGLQNVQVIPTGGHPVVFGESLNAPGKPTLLIYGHYDVQPPEPLELWLTGPFEPTQRGEHLFARGATDMKGQVLASIKAVESILRTAKLPINVKFLIEGEEEIGSPNLDAFLERSRDLLACDLVLNPDAGILGPDTPTIAYGLRGLAYFELRVYGPDHDLHSGVFGGAVHNPAQALCELIAGMHDEQGRITLPGFYDAVRPLEAEERGELARLPITDASVLAQTGAPALWGEAGYTSVERAGARPTLEVHGLLSGFTGAGTKTVLPAWAMAKISCRLVPDQDPEEVYRQFTRYLETHAPPTIRWEVDKFAGSPASISERNSSGIQAYSRAMESVWGKRPVFKREGGSVPVVTQFKKILGVESINTGFSMPGDNMHSPNEMLHLPTLWKGIDAFIHFFYNLSE